MKDRKDRNHKAVKHRNITWLKMTAALLLISFLFTSGCGKGEKGNKKAFEKVPENPKPGAMVRANPQRTGVYPDSGKVPEGVFLWKVKERSLPRMTPLAVTKGEVYYSAWNMNALVCCDAMSGELKWKYVTDPGNEKTWEPPPEFPTSPVIAGEAVFFGTSQGRLYALEAETGNRVWVFQAGGEITSSPLVQDGMVYFGSTDGCFYALDARTGEEVWSFDAGAPMLSSPALDEGILYVRIGSIDEVNGLVALDARRGKELWRLEQVGASYYTPCLSGGNVYFINEDDFIYAADAKTGHMIWKKLGTKGFLLNDPAAYKGKLYLGESEGYVYALDQKTGDEIWRVKLEKGVTSSPSIADGVLYISSEDQNLYALDCETGREIWRVFLGMDAAGPPAIMDGIVYTCVGAIR